MFSISPLDIFLSLKFAPYYFNFFVLFVGFFINIFLAISSFEIKLVGDYAS
jgi:hypothetical protein